MKLIGDGSVINRAYAVKFYIVLFMLKKITAFHITFSRMLQLLETLNPGSVRVGTNTQCTTFEKSHNSYETVQPVGLISLSGNWVILQNQIDHM